MFFFFKDIWVNVVGIRKPIGFAYWAADSCDIGGVFHLIAPYI
jgi:hypothetical protein